MGIQLALFQHDKLYRLDFITIILFDHKYKYLGAFGFVLASKNNGTIKPLFVCTKANYGTSLTMLTSMAAVKY